MNWYYNVDPAFRQTFFAIAAICAVIVLGLWLCGPDAVVRP